MTIIALRMKQLREEKGLSLREGADVVGVAKSTLHRWESGYTDRVSTGNIKAMAAFYNVNPLWIIGITDDKSVEPEPVDAFAHNIAKRFSALINEDKVAAYNAINEVLNYYEHKRDDE